MSTTPMRMNATFLLAAAVLACTVCRAVADQGISVLVTGRVVVKPDQLEISVAPVASPSCRAMH